MLKELGSKRINHPAHNARRQRRARAFDDERVRDLRVRCMPLLDAG
jgi:hypothetical protein